MEEENKRFRLLFSLLYSLVNSVPLPDAIALLLRQVPEEERGQFLQECGFSLERAERILQQKENTAGENERSSALRLFTDGASRGNPGLSGAGFLIQNEKGAVLFEGRKFLGTMTNNMAEWNALLLGLERARKFGSEHIECFLDSELVVKQMKGEYRVKHPDLQPLHQKVSAVASHFNKVTWTHVPREQNTEADRLSNEAIDQQA